MTSITQRIWNPRMKNTALWNLSRRSVCLHLKNNVNSVVTMFKLLHLSSVQLWIAEWTSECSACKLVDAPWHYTAVYHLLELGSRGSLSCSTSVRPRFVNISRAQSSLQVPLGTVADDDRLCLLFHSSTELSRVRFRLQIIIIWDYNLYWYS